MNPLASAMQLVFGKNNQNPQAQPAVAPGQPPASNNPAKQGEPQIQTAQSQQTAPNGTVPADGAKPAVSPLADYKDLWNPTPVDPNAPKPKTGPTPEEIMAAAAKVDFTKVLDKEQLAILSKGGEGAAEALLNLLNQASQASYGQSAVTTQKMLTQAAESERNKILQSLPTLMKKQATQEALRLENPGFSDPAVSPIVDAVVEQLTEKYPKLSQTELLNQAKKMLLGTAEVLKPTPTPVVESQEKEDPAGYWDAYLTGQDVFKK